ncbi:hypothetical protein GQR58_019315 [Nymphon striatum]|nr:hypothetical protein GQR58_019315 [Nymphon striatum]
MNSHVYSNCLLVLRAKRRKVYVNEGRRLNVEARTYHMPPSERLRSSRLQKSSSNANNDRRLGAHQVASLPKTSRLQKSSSNANNDRRLEAHQVASLPKTSRLQKSSSNANNDRRLGAHRQQERW